MLLQVVPNVLSHLLQLAPVDTFGLCPDGTADGRELLDDPGFFPGQDGHHVADGVQKRGQRDDEALAAFSQTTGAGQFAVFVGFDDAVREPPPGANHRDGGRLELLLDLFPGDGVVLGRGRQALLRQMQEGGLGQTDVSPAFAFSLQDQAPFAAPTCTMRHNDNAPMRRRGLGEKAAKDAAGLFFSLSLEPGRRQMNSPGATGQTGEVRCRLPGWRNGASERMNGGQHPGKPGFHKEARVCMKQHETPAKALCPASRKPPCSPQRVHGGTRACPAPVHRPSR